MLPVKYIFSYEKKYIFLKIIPQFFFPTRLSESNMTPISSQIEDLFRTKSRADLSQVLAETVIGACVSSVVIPERLISEQMLLVAILHNNVGSEVGECNFR